MKFNIAQWIVCSAACMAVGCSGLERHIRPSEQATVYASPSLQSDAVSQSKTGIDTPLDQNHALRSQPVSQAAYAHQSSQASGVVEPASVDVVMVDPVTSNEAIADGATLEGHKSVCTPIRCWATRANSWLTPGQISTYYSFNSKSLRAISVH